MARQISTCCTYKPFHPMQPFFHRGITVHTIIHSLEYINSKLDPFFDPFFSCGVLLAIARCLQFLCVLGDKRVRVIDIWRFI